MSSTLRVNSISDAAGANGNAISLATDGTCTAKVTNQLSHKNVIVNGSMAIAQRGTSETGISSQGKFRKAPDRFKFSVDDGTWTASQDSSGPPGIANSYKVLCTSLDGSIDPGNETTLNYKAEGLDLQRFCKGTSSAKKFALSFYVKSNKTGNYAVHMRDQDNTRHVSNLYTISSADTWERKTIVFPADTTGAFGDDNGNSLQITWFLSVGTNKTSGTMDTSWAAVTDANIAAGHNVNLSDTANNYFNLTGVQLEIGDYGTTEFEQRSYSDELQRCLRYCYCSCAKPNDPVAIGAASSSDYALFTVHFPVKMRAEPAMESVSGGSGVEQWELMPPGNSSAYFSALNGSGRASLTHFNVRANISSNFTAKQAYFLNNANAGGTDANPIGIIFDAEL